MLIPVLRRIALLHIIGDDNDDFTNLIVTFLKDEIHE